MAKYAHGGDLNSFAKINNCKTNDIIDLSSNINFIQPNIELQICDIDIKSYPSYDILYDTLSSYFKVSSLKIELFNGASSAIFSLMRHFTHHICYIYSPAYLEYKKSAELTNKQIIHINRYKNIYQNIKTNSLIVFVNPSTPDGLYYNLEKLLEKWVERKCTIIIDESFLEFSRHKSLISKIDKIPNLYIIKSITKFHSCAGIRVGLVISSEKNISKLKEFEPLWKISNYDSLILCNMFTDNKFKINSFYENKLSKNYLLNIVKKYDFFDKTFNISHSSCTNFILVKLVDIDSYKFQDMLANYYIMVRNCNNFDFLDERYIRIAVKDMKSMKIFEKALNNVIF